jgi:hypothetical protein
LCVSPSCWAPAARDTAASKVPTAVALTAARARGTEAPAARRPTPAAQAWPAAQAMRASPRTRTARGERRGLAAQLAPAPPARPGPRGMAARALRGTRWMAASASRPPATPPASSDSRTTTRAARRASATRPGSRARRISVDRPQPAPRSCASMALPSCRRALRLRAVASGVRPVPAGGLPDLDVRPGLSERLARRRKGLRDLLLHPLQRVRGLRLVRALPHSCGLRVALARMRLGRAREAGVLPQDRPRVPAGYGLHGSTALHLSERQHVPARLRRGRGLFRLYRAEDLLLSRVLSQNGIDPRSSRIAVVVVEQATESLAPVRPFILVRRRGRALE